MTCEGLGSVSLTISEGKVVTDLPATANHGFAQLGSRRRSQIPSGGIRLMESRMSNPLCVSAAPYAAEKQVNSRPDRFVGLLLGGR